MKRFWPAIALATIAVSALAGCGSGFGSSTGSHARVSTVSEVRVSTVNHARGDVAKGGQLFFEYCSGCHTPGVGLENFAKTAAFIKHPVVFLDPSKSPMPGFYPSPLTGKDVNDIAAYLLSV